VLCIGEGGQGSGGCQEARRTVHRNFWLLAWFFLRFPRGFMMAFDFLGNILRKRVIFAHSSLDMIGFRGTQKTKS
jgi:hypothetical protein